MMLLRATWSLIVDYKQPLLKVHLPLFLVGAAIYFWAVGITSRTLLKQVDGLGVFPGMWSFVGVNAAILLAAGLGQAVLAVMWHRLVLASGAPRITLSAYFRYLGAVIWIFLFFVVLALLFQVPVGILFAAAPGLVFSHTAVLIAPVVSFVTSVVVLWIWLRVALILPAAATDDEWVGINESWALTIPWRKSLWSIAAVQAVLFLPLDLDVTLPWALDIAVWLVFWPVGSLLGLAALTWMYREIIKQE